MTIVIENPWKHHDAKEYEYVRSEDSWMRALERGDGPRLYKHCQYHEIKIDEPIYVDSTDPIGHQDIAVFKPSEDDEKRFEISKRIVDLEGNGRWNVGDWLSLYIAGCCNIVAIHEE